MKAGGGDGATGLGDVVHGHGSTDLGGALCVAGGQEGSVKVGQESCSK